MLLGGTGCGKSTFCNMLTKRKQNQDEPIFKSSSGDSSCTTKFQIEKNLTWFDTLGKVTLIDAPGLHDTQSRD